MKTVQVLETDFGCFPTPPEIRAVLRRCRKRKDRQPDRRTRAGKKWVALFAAFTDERRREYLAGLRKG